MHGFYTSTLSLLHFLSFFFPSFPLFSSFFAQIFFLRQNVFFLAIFSAFPILTRWFFKIYLVPIHHSPSSSSHVYFSLFSFFLFRNFYVLLFEIDFEKFFATGLCFLIYLRRSWIGFFPSPLFFSFLFLAKTI